MILTKKSYIILALTIILFFRMFSIFSMLPVSGIYEVYLQISNKKLIGISIGIYGLMQAILQIPFGLLSDFVNKKLIIIFGLLIFSIGSIIGIYSDNIYGIIICRFLQGLSAISSIIINFFSNFIEKKHYKLFMSSIGIIIGVSFLFSIVIVPIILQKIGLHGLFLITTITNLISILIITFVPDNKNQYVKNKFSIHRKQIFNIFTEKNLLIVNCSIFFLHAILVSIFLVLPSMMINSGLPMSEHWKIYLLTILLSYFISISIIHFFKNRTNYIFIYSLAFLLLSEYILLFSYSKIYLIFFGIQIFFSVFNIMETLLPIVIKSISNKKHIGLSMGIYFTSQFLGSAFSGLINGIFYQTYGIKSVFSYCILITCIWLVLFLSKKQSFTV